MRKRVLLLTIAFLTVLLQLIIGSLVFKPKDLDQVTVLNDGWNVNYNGTEYTGVKLSYLRRILGHAGKQGDRIVLTTTLPPTSDKVAPSLFFETRFSKWKVTFGETEMKSLMYDVSDDNLFIGCSNNVIALPKLPEPTVITLELVLAENGAYAYYEAPIYGSYHELLRYLVYDNLYIFFTSAFLIIFGIMFFAIAEGFRNTVSEVTTQIFTSLLFITFGIWFLTQFKLLDLFVDTGLIQTEIEYTSLYLTIPLMYMVMGSSRDYLHSKLFVTFAVTGSFVAILPIILHFTGLVHINHFLVVYQLDAVVLFAFMIITLIRDSKHKQIAASQQVQLAGQSLLIIAFAFNVIFYYLEVAGISEQIMLSKKVIPLATLGMAFGVLANYQLYISESFARQKEYESLAHLAYADALTDIPNRSRYEKYASDLAESNADYCTVSIDLNGLKTVNDVQGHLAGDRYLSEFSKVLAESAKDTGFIARIGGDEFVAILEGENINRAEELINTINTKLDALNKRDPSISRSAAAGYALSNEVPENDWHAVYLLADERMYRLKEKMHAARKS